MWPGGASTYNGTGLKYNVTFNATTPWTDKVDMALDFIAADISPANCVFLYFKEPDFTSHRYGPFSNETLQQLRLINNITGYLTNKIRTLGIESKLNLIMLSDHGMAVVPRNNQIQLNDIVPSKICKSVSHGPMVGIFPNEGKLFLVYVKGISHKVTALLTFQISRYYLIDLAMYAGLEYSAMAVSLLPFDPWALKMHVLAQKLKKCCV